VKEADSLPQSRWQRLSRFETESKTDVPLPVQGVSGGTSTSKTTVADDPAQFDFDASHDDGGEDMLPPIDQGTTEPAPTLTLEEPTLD
jgi:hypothetical protein